MFSFLLNRIPRPWLIKFSLVIRPFLVLWLKGNKFQDPIDGRYYRKFLPYGYENPRPNVLAPGTLSLERHRLLWLFLQNETSYLKPEKKYKVLHFAPEQAFFKKFKKIRHWNYVTTDIESPLADVKADICQLPFEDNTFDLVLCSHVLEHISDDVKAMSELYRVMKPGGIGIFQVPMNVNLAKTYEDARITLPEERRRAFGQYDHVRVYGLDYFERLKDVGFEVNPVCYAEKLGNNQTEKYRLDKTEILPVCTKIIR